MNTKMCLKVYFKYPIKKLIHIFPYGFYDLGLRYFPVCTDI